MPQHLSYLKETASQTAGPYVHIGLAPGAAGFDIYATELGHQIAAPEVPGPRITVQGRVLDGLGTPVKDVLIEVWQADAAGCHPHPDDPRAAQVHPGFRGWGRVVPDFDTGVFRFDTIRPGPVPGPGGRMQAPHLSLWLVARGISIGLATRMYFPDDDTSADPLLALIEQPARRATLVATRAEPGLYLFDIVLQGQGETVFLDI